MNTQKFLIAIMFALAIFCSANIYANEKPGKIHGSIVEQHSNQPIPYANVALIDLKTHNIVTGGISSEQGTFVLENVDFARYELQVSYLGYQKCTLAVEVSPENSSCDIGQIKLEPSAEKLNEILVEEERLKGKQEIDRTVYTVNEKIQKLSQNGTDVLKHIPGVSVDFQDNITLEGTGNILYLVNDIPRDQQFIAQLNPADFNKVEVITNPGVEYDADIDAVINIVLKKRPTGGRGGISLTLADPKKIASNHRANLEYGGEKFRVYLSDNLNYQSYKAFSKQETRVGEPGNQTHLIQEGDGYASWTRNNLNYGLDVFINEKNTINYYGSSYIYRSFQDDIDEHGIQKFNNNLVAEYDLLTNMKSIGRGLYNSLYYKHDFKGKRHNFTSQVNYYTYKSDANNEYGFLYTYLDSLLPNPFILNRSEDIENHREMVEWRNDYAVPIGNYNLKGGYWSYYQWYDNYFNNEIGQNRNFIYNELRQEAYVNGNGAFGKLQWNTGIRMIYSRNRIDQKATNTYTEWLPQLSLMYGIKKGQSLRFTARRRIARPSLNQMNPFETFTDSVTINSGNPDLDPQLINRAELQYAINFKSNYIAPKAYFEYTTNSIQQSHSINEAGYTILQPENVGERTEYGLSLTSAVNFFRWFRLNMFGRIYNVKVGGSDNYSESLWSASANGSAIFTPWKERNISFMAITQYMGPRLGHKLVRTRDVLFLVGVNADIKDNFSVKAVFNPMSQKFKYDATERTGTNYYAYQEGRVDVSQLFMVTLSYNFKWGQEPKKLERSTEYESDGGNGLF